MSDTVTFDARTALVVVDVQNDFADPRGSLYVDGGEQIVPVVNQLAAAARESGAVVVYTQDWHPPATPHFQSQGGQWPVHCVQETWGAQLHADLDVAGPVLRKGSGGEDGYSGFAVRDVGTGAEQPTELDAMLRDHDVRRVVIVGLAEDVCVKETAVDARRLDYETIVLREATRAVKLSPRDEHAAIEAMEAAGVTVR